MTTATSLCVVVVVEVVVMMMEGGVLWLAIFLKRERFALLHEVLLHLFGRISFGKVQISGQNSLVMIFMIL